MFDKRLNFPHKDRNDCYVSFKMRSYDPKYLFIDNYKYKTKQHRLVFEIHTIKNDPFYLKELQITIYNENKNNTLLKKIYELYYKNGKLSGYINENFDFYVLKFLNFTKEKLEIEDRYFHFYEQLLFKEFYL